MKKVLGLIAASMLLATSAWAVEAAPQYNCDYQPSCEVGPGIYGAMSSPVMSKFNLSIGGFVKAEYAYNSYNNGNWGAISPNGPIPAAHSAAQVGDQSILTARESRFWLKSNGPTFLGAKTTALIEGDFYGDPSAAQESPQFRMRHAYLAMDWANTQVLFGQYWDTWGPAISDTIDFRMGSATGTPNTPRVPQLRLSQKIPFNSDNSLKLILALQDPQQDGNNAENIQLPSGTKSTPISITGNATNGSVVNLAGQINFESKALGVAPGLMGVSQKPMTLGVFGMAGSQKTNVKLTGVQAPTTVGHAIDVYGYGVYGFIPVLKSKDGKTRAMTMSLEAQGYVSAGMTFNSSNANQLAATSSTATGAKGYGVYGQIRFFPTQDLGIVGGYGRRNVLDAADQVAAGKEIYNEEIYGNVSYDLNAAIRVQTEYQHMRSQYKGAAGSGQADSGQANVIRLCAYYFF